MNLSINKITYVIRGCENMMNTHNHFMATGHPRPQSRTWGFCWEKFYCPHTLADATSAFQWGRRCCCSQQHRDGVGNIILKINHNHSELSTHIVIILDSYNNTVTNMTNRCHCSGSKSNQLTQFYSETGCMCCVVTYTHKINLNSDKRCNCIHGGDAIWQYVQYVTKIVKTVPHNGRKHHLTAAHCYTNWWLLAIPFKILQYFLKHFVKKSIAILKKYCNTSTYNTEILTTIQILNSIKIVM